MSGFPILDLVVGMIFIFFLLSIICSSAVELVFTMFRTRAYMLQKWLKAIFDQQALDSEGHPAFQPLMKNGKPVFEQLKDKDGNALTDAKGEPVYDKTKPVPDKAKPLSIGQAIMDHCTTTALSGMSKSPSYINPENFVSALLDRITVTPADKAPERLEGGVVAPPNTLEKYIESLKNSPVISGELKRTFLALAYESVKESGVKDKISGELQGFRERLELWYNKNQERLTGQFKARWVSPLTFTFGLLFTVFLNADSVAISRYLYTNKDVSSQLAAQAMDYIKKEGDRMERIKNAYNTTTPLDSSEAGKKLDTALKQVQHDIRYFSDSLPKNLPLGWEKDKVRTKDGKVDFWQTFSQSIPQHGVGWAATVLAICLGAPFWFDILNKIANLRNAGSRPPTNNAEKEKDD